MTDAHVIERFVGMLGLKRGNTPGLSIVVPSVDERVSIADLRRGIVRSFFWPVLQGELVVDLESPTEHWHIDAETLASQRALLPANEAAVVEFAAWASTAKPAEIVSLPAEAATRPEWRAIIDAILPETRLTEIRSRLEQHDRVGVKVTVRVRPKFDGGEESTSFFTVFIAPCRDAGFRPIFLRDGIVITDVRSPQMSGNRSLVVVEDPPLAGLLGDSEGVNHTQWQKDSAKFHNRYIYGADTIKFVSRSVYEIMQRLHAAETKGDPNLLLDIFYLPMDEGPTEPTKKPKPERDGPVVEPPPPPPPRKPRHFILDSTKGQLRRRLLIKVSNRLPRRKRSGLSLLTRSGIASKSCWRAGNDTAHRRRIESLGRGQLSTGGFP